ncbi:MAG: helix-turn-helix domain-containing protein [Gemmatimonadaceae bacterium]|nr:helix-turn-helix domain-containing protein [Gemmatimonadaceae bacterium]
MSEQRATIIAMCGGFTANELAAIEAAVPCYVAAYRFLNRPFDETEGAHTKVPRPTADEVLTAHGIRWNYKRERVRLCDIYGEVIARGMAEVGGPLVQGEIPDAPGRGRGHLPADLDDRVAKLFQAGTHHKNIAAKLNVSVVTVYRRIAIMKEAGTIQL